MGAILDAFAYGLISTLIWYPAIYTAFRGTLKRRLPLPRFWAGFAVADFLDGFLGRLVEGSLSKEASSIAFALAIPVVVGVVVLYVLYFLWPKDVGTPPASTSAEMPKINPKPYGVAAAPRDMAGDRWYLFRTAIDALQAIRSDFGFEVGVNRSGNSKALLPKMFPWRMI